MLNATIVSDDILLRERDCRSCEVEILLSEFRSSFRMIEYELDAKSRTLNAQAFARGRLRIVRLYGGLAFHPDMNSDAFVFTLLHETGHHYASGQRFASDPMLACDCAADKWAVTIGAEKLRRECKREFNIGRALDGLDAALASLRDSSVAVGSGNTRNCWALDWPMRKFSLRSGPAITVARSCHT